MAGLPLGSTADATPCAESGLDAQLGADRRSPCPTCGSPERIIWTFGRYPALDRVRDGNWITLHRCPECRGLWCSVPHEPHAGFLFFTAWPHDERAFEALAARDDALVLHEWHDAVIRERWRSLPAEEQAWVEEWRDRTYRRYNAIDRGPEIGRPRFIRESRDLAKFVEGIGPPVA